ncbi:uncharacterized protein [Rutidosis leptorrhynchoides]|uniref:uncharacterized protein n=1 Tax=Rutidosis leptorrhynchoides TaxID=125765 RepID=UPI003A9A4B29
MVGEGSEKRKREDDSSDTEINEFSFNNHSPSSSNDRIITIFVKIYTGKTISLEVKLSDTINHIKTLIERKERICPNQQVLILDDTVFEDTDIVADFYIENKQPVLTLISKSLGLIRIFVKKIACEPYLEHTFSLNVKPSDTIINVKHKIYSKCICERYPVDEQRLIYNDMLLDDNGTLADFHIKKDSTLKLLKSSGGWIKIFVKTLSSGKTISERVKPSYTVSKVKELIESSVGIHPNEQVLMFNDMVLDDCCTLADFDIGRDCTLTLIQKSDAKMQIFIKMMDGNTIIMKVKPLVTIDRVKTAIERLKDIPYDQQRLIFEGRPLEDWRTLKHYNINNGSTLHLILRLIGG